MVSKPRAIIAESVRARGIVLIAVGNVVNDQLHVIVNAPVSENVTEIVSVSVMEGELNQYTYIYFIYLIACKLLLIHIHICVHQQLPGTLSQS